MSDRIKQLEKFVVEDPGDPFTLYALALEYLKIDNGKALDIFDLLVTKHADYLPTYYQLAKLYEGLGKNENAIEIFHQGIIIAKQQNDTKTLLELRAGLEEIE